MVAFALLLYHFRSSLLPFALQFCCKRFLSFLLRMSPESSQSQYSDVSKVNYFFHYYFHISIPLLFAKSSTSTIIIRALSFMYLTKEQRDCFKRQKELRIALHTIIV